MVLAIDRGRRAGVYGLLLLLLVVVKLLLLIRIRIPMHARPIPIRKPILRLPHLRLSLLVIPAKPMPIRPTLRRINRPLRVPRLRIRIEVAVVVVVVVDEGRFKSARLGNHKQDDPGERLEEIDDELESFVDGETEVVVCEGGAVFDDDEERPYEHAEGERDDPAEEVLIRLLTGFSFFFGSVWW